MANTNLKKSKAVYFIFITVLFFPTFILSFQSDGDIFDVNFFQTTAYFLSGYVLLLTVLGSLFKKPYVTIFFGCHDHCERRFHILHNVLPICGRCTGIYFGFFLAIPLSYLNIPFYWFIPLGIPLVIDGLIQIKGMPSTMNRRLITGLLFGPAMVSLFGLYNAIIVYLVERTFIIYD